MQAQLKEYLFRTGLSESEFSRRYKISQPYLNQIKTGARKAGRKTAVYLETISEGFVKKSQLRPDLWG